MKNKTKVAGILLITGISLTFALSASAVEPNGLRNTLRNSVRQEAGLTVTPVSLTVTPIQREIRKEIMTETKDLKRNIIDTVKDKIKTLLPRRIHGTIAGIAADKTSLTVKTDGGLFTVYISANTQLKRRFGGNSTIGEFAVNDEVAVIGKPHSPPSGSSSSTLPDSSIDARYIRDLSIQRRNTVFVGTITAMGTDSFTVRTASRGTQTVYVVTGSTVITQRDAKISFADLHQGDRVLIKGLIWNREANKIDAARIMKLPSVPAGSSSSSTGSTSSGASSSVQSSSAAASSI